MTISGSNGNVGIGTAVPTAKLHLTGSTNSMLRIESQDNSDTTPTVYIEGNKGGSDPYTATLIELKSNNEFRGKGIHMTTAGSNTRWFAGVPYNSGLSGYQIGYDGSTNGRAYTPESSSLFIDTSGNVGIGTTSPGAQLHLSGAASIRTTNNSNSTGFDIGLLGGNSDANAYIYQRANASLFLGTNNSTKVTINGSGNVTIVDLSGTGDRIVGTNSSGLLSSITVGSGLSLSGGTLTATGGSAGTVTGTGASTQVTYWTSTSNVTGSNGFVYDNSTGKVGIANPSPTTAKLVIGGTAAQEGLDLATADQYANLRVIRNSLNGSDKDMYIGYQSGVGSKLHLYSNNSETITVSGGNVGIGTTTPTVKLHVSGGSCVFSGTADQMLTLDATDSSWSYIGYSWAGTRRFYTGLDNAGKYVFGSDSAAVFYFTGGNVGIANATPSYPLDVIGDARINTGALGVGVVPNAVDGTISALADIIAYASDKRLKNNVQILDKPLEKINKLTGFTYNWNEKAKEVANYDTEELLVGVFAQDVQAVLPEAVKLAPFDNDGNNKSISGENYLTVQYEKIVPLLIEAIKEQQKQIDELKYLLQNK